jgi:AcrR family transcriptional regulator
MATLSRHTTVSEDARQRNGQAFLDATTDLLGEGIAFADLGVGQIAEKAGFSRPTFYAHFRDKRELLLTLGAGLDVKVHEVAEPWLRGEQEGLRETLAAVAQTFRDNAATVGAVVEAATYDPHIADFWRSFHEVFVNLARDRLLAGDPSIGATAAEARAFALVWMTERALTENILAPRVDDDALLDALEAQWRSAVGPDV